MGFFDKLKQGMNKTKETFNEKINNVFSNFRKVDENFLDELEEVLIMSDIGMDTSIKIISNLRERMKKEKLQDEEDVKRALREEMKKILDVTDVGLNLNTKPSVILVVGVNGVGKTTSIGKIANRLAKDGKKVKKDPLRELDMRLINNPYLALTESRHLIGRMAKAAQKNFRSTQAQLENWDPKVHEKIMERENKLDKMTDAANRYILVMSPYITLEQDSQEQSFQLRAMTCFERIGDLAVNIEGNLKNLTELDHTLSITGKRELNLVFAAADEILTQAIMAFGDDSVEKAQRVEPLEEVIDELIQTVKSNHLRRMTQGRCDVGAGIQ